MCTKFNCPKANGCFRIRAETDENQHYDSFIALCNESDNYKYFMKIRPEDKVLGLDEILKNNKELEKLPENKCLEIGIPEP
jgi:hypothetical protein